MAIYGRWIVSVVEACDKVLLNGHKKLLDLHNLYGHLMTNEGKYYRNVMEILLRKFPDF